MRFDKNINWEWILENMRRCDKCYTYKTLDQFNSKKDRCRYCETKPTKCKNVKPIAHLYKDDSIIYNSFDLKEVKPFVQLRWRKNNQIYN